MRAPTRNELRAILRCDGEMWERPALEKARRLHPHYHLGPGSDREGWRSIITDESCAGADLDVLARQMPTLDLARTLWERRQGAFEAVRDARRLAVADPIGSLVTLAYQAGATTCSGDFLEECFHRFFRHIRPFERWLTQRPGLQIVIVGSERELFQQLQTAFQNASRRMGEAAADVDVRWVQDSALPSGGEGKIDSALEATLAGHPPTAPWDRANAPDNEWIKGEIGALDADLQRLGHDGHDVYAAGRQLTTILRRPVLQPTSATALLATISRPVNFTAIRMEVRRFLLKPLTMTLAPVSLLASENASGKTTLVEGICNVYLGRPRMRFMLPERATLWDDRGRGTPQIAALRIRSGTDGERPKRAALLCLFADDADLPSGETGETALTAWWSLRGDDRDRLATAMTGLQERLQHLHKKYKTEGSPNRFVGA